MAETTLFDKTNNLYDPDVYDCLGKFEYTISESSSISDSIARVGTQIRHISDPRQLFDGVLFDTDLYQTAGVTTDITDSVSRLMQTFRTIAATTISISDSIAKSAGISRVITEEQTLFDSDNNLYDPDVYDTIQGDIIPVSDDVVEQIPTSNRYIFDYGSVFDSAIYSSPPFDNTVTSYEVADSVSRLMNTFRSVSESVSISDSISRIYNGVRTLTESVSISDSVGRVMSAFRTITDTSISVSDNVSRIYGALRSVSESVSISDSVSRLMAAYRTLTQSVSVSDNVSRLMSTFRTITESTISVSDSISRILGAVRNMSESVSVSDSISKAGSTFTRSISEVAVSVSDSISRLMETFRTITDSSI